MIRVILELPQRSRSFSVSQGDNGNTPDRRILIWRPVGVSRSRLGLLLAGLIALGALAAPPLAEAHDDYDNMFKTGNTWWNCSDQTVSNALFCQTDNATLRWFAQSSVANSGENNIRDVLEASFEATVLSVSVQNPPSYSGGSETDIIYQAGNTNGALGLTWCNDAVSSTRCDQHYVRFDVSSPFKRTICHESGHAVGLTHGAHAAPQVSNGLDSLHCMQTPLSQITDTVLGGHNQHQINDTY